MRRTIDDQQLELFRARPGDMALRDAQDLMSWPFFSLAKTRRVRPIDFQMGEVSIRVEATPQHGMATIWDADVLIWAASQIVDARDRGLRTSRLMAATPLGNSSPSGNPSVHEMRATRSGGTSPARYLVRTPGTRSCRASTAGLVLSTISLMALDPSEV